MRSLRNNSQGLILMVSLWILAIISLLCISLAHRVVINLKLVRFQKDKVRCLYIAKAALQKAINVLDQDLTPETDTLNELWSTGYDLGTNSYIFKDVELGGGIFTVKYVFSVDNNGQPVYFYGICDEHRKININKASRELLVSFFSLLEFGQPETLAENIIYWRGDAPEGYKDSYYESPEVPYPARKAPCKTIEELYFVKGFRENPDLINECERFLTVYTEDNLININTSPLDILKSVFMSLGAESVRSGLSDKLVNNIIDFRDGDDGQEATNDDVAINQDEIKTVLKTGLIDPLEIDWIDNQVFPFTVKSNLFRIEVLAKLNSSSIQKKVNAVIDQNTQPPKFRYWHEE